MYFTEYVNKIINTCIFWKKGYNYRADKKNMFLDA